MPKKDQWKAWKDLVRSDEEAVNVRQLKKILHSVRNHSECTQEVVAGALSVARVMLEVEEGAEINPLALCLLHSGYCTRCLLIDQRQRCSVGWGTRNRLKKVHRMYDALHENYLQGDG